MQFITRAYNLVNIDYNNQTIIKKSKSQRFFDEIRYYQSIPKSLNTFFPAVVSFNTNSEEKMLEIEYYDYQDLGKQMLSNTEEVFWNKTSTQILNVLHKMSDIKNNKLDKKYMQNMYISKTEIEYNNLILNKEFEKISNYDTLIIDGKECSNFKNISSAIFNLANKILIKDIESTMVHGDFCFGNILCSSKNNIIKLIDPRGSWGEVGIYGDNRYDLAKLYHSYHGKYEYIVSDNFSINQDENIFSTKFSNDNNTIIYNIFKNNVINHLYKDDLEIKLIEGLIYIGMCARHYDSLDRQKIMYITGVNILNDVLENSK